MDMLFARQPIFSFENKVYGYELLYRNEFDKDTTNFEKTIDALTNTNTFFLNMDVQINSKKMFLNFDRELLLESITEVLSPSEHVIEILENVEPDRIVINRIIQLKRLGFQIALDDYTIRYPHEPFVDLADIIKVDFMANSMEEIIRLSKREKFQKKILLAEKVENENMHHLAKQLNYKLLQGFYYAKPIMHKGNYISINVKTCLEILGKLNSPEEGENGEDFVDLYKISRQIEKDPILTFKIIQIANAVRTNLYVKIDSLLRAITLLGYRKLNKWLKILLFQEVKTRRTHRGNLNREVIKTIIIRIAFIENLLGENRQLKGILGESVLVLMVDLFDILFEMSMEEIVASLGLSNQISDALLNNEGQLALILNMVRNYEEGNWDEVKLLCQQVNIKYAELGTLYKKAINDSRDIWQELEK